MGDIILTREYDETYSHTDFKIVVNDIEINTIANDSRKVISLKSGEYDVYVKTNRTSRPTVRVSVKNKATIRLTCGSKLRGIKLLFNWLYIFGKNNLYLRETI